MVGRSRSIGVTKRSLRNAEVRPKRTIQPKVQDDSVGMSRREEQELNRALYASLQDSRRSKSLPDLTDIPSHNTTSSSSSSAHQHSTNSKDDIQTGCDRIAPKNCAARSSRSSTSSDGSHRRKSDTPTERLDRHERPSNRPKKSERPKHRPANHRPHKSFLASKISPKRPVKRSGSQRQTSKKPLTMKRSISLPSTNIHVDETSRDSNPSSLESVNGGSRRKIHAQRKFAQGCSLPGTPASTPAKSVNTPVKIMSSRLPKTEDFLTFLCFRGTSLLPPHLEFFAFSQEELSARDECRSHLAAGSVRKLKRSREEREGTPDSTSSGASSSGGGGNDEMSSDITAGVATPPLKKCVQFYKERKSES